MTWGVDGCRLPVILLAIVTSVQAENFYSKMSKTSEGNRSETKIGFWPLCDMKG